MMKFVIVSVTLLIICMSCTVIAYGGSECDSKSYYKPHPSECTLFYQCSPNGTYILHTCPPDLHFNPILDVCDFPNEARCSNDHTVDPGDGETSSSPDPVASTTVESAEECSTGEYKPHETECDLFYRCISGAFILINCPDGMQFNVTLKGCVVQEEGCNEDDRSSIATDSTTEATDSTTEETDSTTEETDSTTEATDSTTEATDATTESTEATDSTTESTNSTTEANESTTEVTESTTEATDLTTEATESTTEATDLTTEATDSTTEATDLTTEATDLTTEATDLTTEATDLTTEETDSTKATDSTTEATDLTTEATDLTTEATDLTTEATDPTTEATDSTTEATPEADTTTTQCVNNEYRPDENDCEAFYRCINGRFIKLFCSIGTHFDPNTRLCVDPDIAECNLETDQSTNSPEMTETSTNPTTENSTEVQVTIVECYDNEYRPDETDCEAFYRCINGRFVKLLCSIGTNFDPNTRSCVDPEVAECNLETDQRANSPGITTTEGFSIETSTEVQVNIVGCSDNEYQADESDCEAFYRCINGRFVKLFCSIGTHFNLNTRQCVAVELALCELEASQITTSTDTTTFN
ncbi:cell wall protein IFF6-like isoform X2 [Bradysia coprophila]|uniref:cell wall protein IFF6-like isoform X2 n=1 Tax=Bradysia coprophila TaxID=38358 RepID=UPI00187D8632|nr:cell wall protein IFF6-like isoform X2 [Bradysia coprophila]